MVVEKAKGRQVFESIVRQGIDPGLLEWTKGNASRHASTQSSKGDKKIVIAYEQELKDAGKGFLYSLPLHFKAKVDRFHLRAEVFKQEVVPDLGSNELANRASRNGTNPFSPRPSGKTTCPTKASPSCFPSKVTGSVSSSRKRTEKPTSTSR